METPSTSIDEAKIIKFDSAQRKRSTAKKKERNKKQKFMMKQRKKDRYFSEKESQLKIEERVRDLEHENAIIKRFIPKPTKNRISRDMSLSCSSRMATYRSQDKNASIVKTLPYHVASFSESDITTDNEPLGNGSFGTVFKGFIISANQRVAVKHISPKCRFVDIQAECKKAIVMNGHRNFLYIYGLMKPRSILMELYLDFDGKCCPTLKEFLKIPNFKLAAGIDIGYQLCSAVHDMHIRGILHNDLHSRNILIKNRTSIKIIDFGKATLISDPLVYNIKPGSKEQEIYNTVHCFLGYELRNVKGSCQSIESDIFSVGYNIKKIADCMSNEKLLFVAMDMMSKLPEKRPNLSQCITKLKKISLRF